MIYTLTYRYLQGRLSSKYLKSSLKIDKCQCGVKNLPIISIVTQTSYFKCFYGSTLSHNKRHGKKLRRVDIEW